MAGDFLNMREGPAITYRVVQRLENGFDGIVLIGKRVTNGSTGWQKINSRGVVGWVNAEYLTQIQHRQRHSAAGSAAYDRITARVSGSVPVHPTPRAPAIMRAAAPTPRSPAAPFGCQKANASICQSHTSTAPAASGETLVLLLLIFGVVVWYRSAPKDPAQAADSHKLEQRSRDPREPPLIVFGNRTQEHGVLCCNLRVSGASRRPCLVRRPDRTARGALELEVQKVAKAIALHFGLRVTTVIVALRSDLPVAGQVELSADKSTFFVELQREVASCADSLLAVLAHEISHVFLHCNGLRGRDTQSTEILTDTCAMFLGLGHLSLNGVSFAYIRPEEIGYILARRDHYFSTDSSRYLKNNLVRGFYLSGKRRYQQELARYPHGKRALSSGSFRASEGSGRASAADAAPKKCDRRSIWE